ncbi:hypothetical protein OHC33_003932 [Knufia fluminis]|uniref:Allergen n=1 Tax=Knufia fluminis TaxID=191047 RepID=A0AAN8IA76_9EURO|nr:hypothetical protein OHC33_003932 [Knufia fluminis]
MDAARAAVNKITSRTGHKTDVDEYVNPAVVSETVKPHRHEETQEAIDREVHQDHYHTTVQPVAHKERLPEQHRHNIVPQVEREFRHDNEAETKQRVSAELGQFQNTSTTHQTSYSTSAAPTVAGEHVHHHVHETVQPVIHKETLQPEVVHTTVPIHEVHHGSAQHHGMSALPMKSLDEFKQAGGIISGSKSHTHEEYDGAPRPYNEKLSTTIEKVLPGHHGSHSGTHTGMGAGAGLAGAGAGAGLAGGRHRSGSSSSSSSDEEKRRTRGTGLPGSHSGHHTGASTGSSTLGSIGSSDRRPDSGVGGVGNNTQQHKPSMMDKLNPRVDANGDGKPGFMK